MFRVSKKTKVIITGVLVLLSFILKELEINVFNIEYYYYRDYGFIITLPNVLMIISTFVAGLSIMHNAVVALRYKIVSIDALVSIAVIGALIIGEYFEAAAVTFLFMLGDFLESRTIDKTRSSIRALLDSSPKVVRVLRDNEEFLIDPLDVNIGEIVIIRPGEKIAVDGVVIEGSAYINQAAITGEALAVYKTIEDYAYSGTIIESGYIIIKAEKVGEDTTFAKILQMVEEAQDKKARTQKFFEKFSKYYTPAIIMLALIFLIFTRDLRLSLTLLVISCPGALVISTPVSIVAGIGNGAKNGVLVKGGESLELIGKVKVLAFDKTGTLTMGLPEVTRIKTFSISENELLRVAMIAESYSEHPLAKAIINKGKEVLGKIEEFPQETEIITSQGLKALIDNQIYLLGNRKLFTLNNIDYAHIEEYLSIEEEKGQTVIMVANETEIIGVISIADTIRPDAKELISDLRRQGIQKIIMLTGDNRRSARAISDQLGIDEFYAELMPEDKVKVLQTLQEEYGPVAMIGDGINDAPALASADIGIAIGIAGADVAMEIADMVLMSDKIKHLSHAIGLSRATVANIKQNITFALFVSFGLLLGVILHTVHLALGMLIHEISVIIVLLNAIRLLRFKKK